MRDTYFAPVERTDPKKLRYQINTISHSPVMNALLKTVAGLLIVVNEDRQIVALNHAFLETMKIKDPDKILGFRLGETLECKHATDPPYGCGTTPHCATCGAVIAMMTAIRENKADERICAVTSIKNGMEEDISFLIRAEPIEVENSRWILLIAQDVTLQQFWTNLEDVFFHDINNMIAPLIGYSELLAIDYPKDAMVRNLHEGIVRLSNEISVQKTLSHLKDASYPLNHTVTSTDYIKEEVHRVIDGHKSRKNRTIEATWPENGASLVTDHYLVSRVITNMLLNALEATEENGVVKLFVAVDQAHIIWHVWNRSYIDDDVQKRVFQRHFSTKSNIGRGFGTYSMKLFGEKYLKGEVSFESEKRKGTTFKFSLPRQQAV